MKILEVKKKGWRKRICTGDGNSNIGCGSVLLLDPEDVKIIHHTWIDGSRDTYYSFVCPVCAAMTDIPGDELPASVKKGDYVVKVKKKV